MRTRFYMMRHGETDINRQKRYCGHSDILLNRTGVEQARQLRKRFKGVVVEAIYSSDLKRAQQTTKIIFPDESSKVTLTPLLRELDFGRWEGLTFEEIIAKEGKAYQAWLVNPSLSAPPQGESLADLRHRMKWFIEKTLEEFGGKTVAVVSHAGPIRAFLCEALDMPPGAFWRIALNPAGVSIVDYCEGEPRVLLVNDTCHLKSRKGDKSG